MEQELREIARKLLQELSSPPQPPPTPAPASVPPVGAPDELPVDPLTEREVEVLKLVARGLSNREIADQLVIVEGTVRAHVSNILSKLHLVSRTQATLYALREGLASLDDIDVIQQ